MMMRKSKGNGNPSNNNTTTTTTAINTVSIDLYPLRHSTLRRLRWFLDILLDKQLAVSIEVDNMIKLHRSKPTTMEPCPTAIGILWCTRIHFNRPPHHLIYPNEKIIPKITARASLIRVSSDFIMPSSS